MHHSWLLPISLATLPVAAVAADQTPNARLDPLVQCSAIAERSARLACYDREVAALKKAVSEKQVSIVEQSEVKRSQRELFGTAAPNLKLFDALGEPDIDKLETTVATVGHTGDGRLIFSIVEGSRWEQTDDYPLYGVKPGRKVTLKRGALGSFFAAFDKGMSVRAKRTK